MYEWQQIIQTMIDEIDESLINHHSDQRTLHHLAKKLGYSEYYTTRKFKAVTGMSLRDYLKNRKLAFALKAVRDGNQRLLNIALDFGFSSHEAFTRAFKKRYGITPSAYRKNPRPLVLRTKISPVDCYFFKSRNGQNRDSYLFCHDSCPCFLTYSQLSKQWLLGFLAKTISDPPIRIKRPSVAYWTVSKGSSMIKRELRSIAVPVRSCIFIMIRINTLSIFVLSGEL